jgi:hypothetical protein
MDERRIWRPVFEMELIEVIGQEWPVFVIVTKWEENDLGERRLVESRDYGPPPTHAHWPLDTRDEAAEREFLKPIR